MTKGIPILTDYGTKFLALAQKLLIDHATPHWTAISVGRRANNAVSHGRCLAP